MPRYINNLKPEIGNKVKIAFDRSEFPMTVEHLVGKVNQMFEDGIDRSSSIRSTIKKLVDSKFLHVVIYGGEKYCYPRKFMFYEREGGSSAGSSLRDKVKFVKLQSVRQS